MTDVHDNAPNDAGRLVDVAFLLPTFSGGGAERTFLNLANGLDRDRFRPTVVLYRREGPFLAELRGDVPVVALGCRGAHRSVLPLAAWLRRSRPNVLISTLLHVNAAAVISGRLVGSRVPIIVRETNNHTGAGRPLGSPSWALVRWSYRRADAIVSLSNGVAADIATRYGIGRERIRTIYNPIDIGSIEQAAGRSVDPLPRWSETATGFRVIAVGRLVRQKGFDLLLEALSRLSSQRDSTLAILGSGPEESRLRVLASDLGVDGRVVFAGHVSNPYAYIAQADLLVLSSRWEGFGHVIAEAMVCRTPVVATRCPSGPDEIVEDGVSGRLCEPDSSEALAEAIREVLADPAARQRYVDAAARRVRRFESRVVADEYATLFQDVAGVA